MEISISIPQTHPDPARIPRFLKRAEELPFVRAWSIEPMPAFIILLNPVFDEANEMERLRTRSCVACKHRIAIASSKFRHRRRQTAQPLHRARRRPGQTPKTRTAKTA